MKQNINELVTRARTFRTPEDAERQREVRRQGKLNSVETSKSILQLQRTRMRRRVARLRLLRRVLLLRHAEVQRLEHSIAQSQKIVKDEIRCLRRCACL